MLRLGDSMISRLSGPVTFHYLVPKEEALKDRGIIRLFGDL
jgi:hypothetical protein